MLSSALQIVLGLAGLLIMANSPAISKSLNRKRDKYSGYATTGMLGLGDDNPKYTRWNIGFYGFLMMAGAVVWWQLG